MSKYKCLMPAGMSDDDDDDDDDDVFFPLEEVGSIQRLILFALILFNYDNVFLIPVGLTEKVRRQRE